MKNDIFYRLFALLCSSRTEDFKKELEKFDTFLKEKVVPYQKGNSKKLKEDTPPKIKAGYVCLETKIKAIYLDFQAQMEKIGVNKENLRSFEECHTFIGITVKTKMVLNLLKNFEKEEFNRTLKQRANETGGLLNHLDDVKSELNKVLFPK